MDIGRGGREGGKEQGGKEAETGPAQSRGRGVYVGEGATQGEGWVCKRQRRDPFGRVRGLARLEAPPVLPLPGTPTPSLGTTAPVCHRPYRPGLWL